MHEVDSNGSFTGLLLSISCSLTALLFIAVDICLLLFSFLCYFVLLDEEVFMEELCEDFLGELAPELGHEVARGEALRYLHVGVDL